MWGLHVFTRAGQPFPKISGGIWAGELNITRESDVQELTSTEAQNPLDKRGDKPTSFAIIVTANRLAGLNPVTVYKSWCRDLGKSHYFFIGLLPLSADLYILENVTFRFSGRDCDPSGAPIKGDITLTFTADTVLGRIGKDVDSDILSKTQSGKTGIKKAAKTALNKVNSASIWADVEKTYAAQQK